MTVIKFTINLRGLIALWARSRGLPATKQDCDVLAESIETVLKVKKDD